MLSSRLMLILAQIIILMGGFSLIFASIRLFIRAVNAGMPSWNLYWIVPVAAVLGAIKAIFVMRRRMRENISRLCAAEGKLWPWQIYPYQLLIFILFMMTMMFILKRVLAGSAASLGALGAIDVTIAVALLVSSREYRRKDC